MVFSNTLQFSQAFNFTKKRLQHRCFPVKFAKFLRTPILKKSTNDCYCFWKDNFSTPLSPGMGAAAVVVAITNYKFIVKLDLTLRSNLVFHYFLLGTRRIWNVLDVS